MRLATFCFSWTFKRMSLKIILYLTNQLRLVLSPTNGDRRFPTLYSTLTALNEATDSLSFNTDQRLINAVVTLDLKKAFDTVGHDIQ